MRNIFTVNATQVVVSDSHPEGIKSTVSGFPQDFDSRSYDSTEQNPDGNVDKALSMAKSAYHAQLSQNEANTNPNRVMTTVTLEQADGNLLMHDCIGSFPVIEPVPPEEPEEPEQGEEQGE